MTSKWMKTLCLLLCLLLAVPAFAQETTQGALPYAENLPALPAEAGSLVSMSVSKEGTAYLLTKDSDNQYHLLSYTKADGFLEEAVLDYADGDIEAIDIAPDGNILATLSLMRAFSRMGDAPPADAQSAPVGQAVQAQANMIVSIDSMEQSYLWFDKSGALIKEVLIKGMGSAVKALSGNRIAQAAMGGSTLIYDADGNLLHDTGISGAACFAAFEEMLYMVSFDSIAQYNCATNEAQSFPIELAMTPGNAYISDSKSLYFINADGVYCFDLAEETLSPLMASKGTLIGDPSVSASAFGLLADGSIALTITEGMAMAAGRTNMSIRIGSPEGESATFAVYSPLDPALAGEKKPFVITALINSTRLRKAVSDFQRLHPELEVILQAQLDENAMDVVLDDYIRALNTDLLAGGGGDVLILDGLPMQKYIERGILKDLSDLVPELDILPGMVKGATEADGKVYALPVHFSFDTLWGNKEYIDSALTLADLAAMQESGTTKALAPRTQEELIRTFYPAVEYQFYDENGELHFDTELFATFLETLYRLYAAQDELNDMNFTGGRMRGNMEINMNEITAMQNGAVAFTPQVVSGLMGLSIPYSLTGGEDARVVPLPAMQGKSFTYRPAMLTGIAAKTAMNEVAEEFLKLLYTSDIQTADMMNGLPVTEEALTKQMDEARTRAKDGNMHTMLAMSGGMTLEMSQPNESTLDALMAIINQAQTPVIIDETLLGFIVSETADFFDGRMTKEQAAKAVHEKAWFYINE